MPDSVKPNEDVTGTDEAPTPSRPPFDLPVSWWVTKDRIPGILEALGETFPDLSETLQRASGSRFDGVEVYLMPDEAEAVWDHFERLREDAASIEEGTG